MRRRAPVVGLAQLSAALLDAAAVLRAQTGNDDQSYREALARAVDTARLQLSETRPALARLYLATERLRLGRPSTARELERARKEARHALGNTKRQQKHHHTREET